MSVVLAPLQQQLLMFVSAQLPVDRGLTRGRRKGMIWVPPENPTFAREVSISRRSLVRIRIFIQPSRHDSMNAPTPAR